MGEGGGEREGIGRGGEGKGGVALCLSLLLQLHGHLQVVDSWHVQLIPAATVIDEITPCAYIHRPTR